MGKFIRTLQWVRVRQDNKTQETKGKMYQENCIKLKSCSAKGTISNIEKTYRMEENILKLYM
jgi:hypothetical protein